MNNIKAKRLNLGLTRLELAEKLGVNRSTITQLENNDINLSYENACAIAHAMNSDPFIIAGEEMLKKGFKDESLFDVLPALIDSKFNDIIIEGNCSKEDATRYHILAYLFLFSLSESQLDEILSFIKFKVKNDETKKQLFQLLNLDALLQMKGSDA